MDSGVIVSTTETLGNVAFGYNLSDKEYVIAYTQDGPDGLTLTPDGSKDLNVHAAGSIANALCRIPTDCRRRSPAFHRYECVRSPRR